MRRIFETCNLTRRTLLSCLLLASTGLGLSACGTRRSQNGGSANRTAPQSSQDSNQVAPGVAGSTPVEEKPPNATSSRGITRVSMENVDFHIQDDIVLRIRNLRGALLRSAREVTPTFDDKRSFVLRIESGVVGITADSLASLMNDYVFAYEHSPLKKISVSMDGNRIKLKGTVHKVANLHVEILGSVSPTPDGKIRLHPDKIKTDGIPIKGLMHVFDVELGDVVKAREARGVRVDDKDLILDPELMMPPPAIRGKVTAVQIGQNELVEVFGPGNQISGEGVASASGPQKNYMRYKGGALRFGKLMMTDADLEIVGEGSKGPFDFSIDHYAKQLVAGYSKTTPSLGLVVFMPDYNKIQKSPQKVAARVQ